MFEQSKNIGMFWSKLARSRGLGTARKTHHEPPPNDCFGKVETNLGENSSFGSIVSPVWLSELHSYRYKR